MTARKTLVIERELAHAPGKVWRALTEGHLLKEWLLDNDFQPVVGHRFRFRQAPMPKWDGVVDCEVLVVEPQKKLSYTWNALGLESVVVLTLSETSEGTLLRLEQSGFRPDQETAYVGAGYGWKKFLGNMDRVLGEL